jgi:hypothetical protein
MNGGAYTQVIATSLEREAQITRAKWNPDARGAEGLREGKRQDDDRPVSARA